MHGAQAVRTHSRGAYDRDCDYWNLDRVAAAGSAVARESARRSQCLSNLHQLGIGIEQYIDTHNGHFPWTYHAGNTQTWIMTVAPFLENVDDIRLCPDDPLGEQRVDPDVSGLRGTSYVINEYVAYLTDDGQAVLNINKMSSTHTTIVLFEGANSGARPRMTTFILRRGMHRVTSLATESAFRYWLKSIQPNMTHARQLSVRGWSCGDDCIGDSASLG